MFVDKVNVFITAGKGGNGIVSWRHEKYVDRGGPEGGDGGNGGDVFAVGSTRQNTLAAYRYQKEIGAKDGGNGGKRKRHGKSAPALEFLVPIGTVIYDLDGEVIADVTEEGQKVLMAKGGKGGFGNAHFVSSRRQAPRVAEKGEPGQAFEAVLELKMIAEVGLVGLPNAGKSTLLSRISNAKPEIANYPFTTLTPNLGVADIGKDRTLLVADIPGLIEGASEGKGLGDDFLRHVERTRVLIHLIDAYSDDVVHSYQVIRKELANYKVDLSERAEIVAITKTEGLDTEMIKGLLKQLKKVVKKETPVVAISAASGTGLKELLQKALVAADRYQEEIDEEVERAVPVITLGNTEDRWCVEKHGDNFVVTGKKIERFALRTDFESQFGVERLRDIMRKMGIMHELERQEINPGQTVLLGEDGKHGSFQY